MPKPEVCQIGKEWAAERGGVTAYFREWNEAMRFALGKSVTFASYDTGRPEVKHGEFARIPHFVPLPPILDPRNPEWAHVGETPDPGASDWSCSMQ